MNVPPAPTKRRELPIPAWKKKALESDESAVPAGLDYDDEEITKVRDRISGLRLAESKETGPKFVIGSATEASSEHPERNEDAFEIFGDRGILATADGMGGAPAGDFASHEAVSQLQIDKIDGALSSAKTVKEIKTAELIKSVFGSSKDATLAKKNVETAISAMLLRMNDEVEKLGQTEVVRKKIEDHLMERPEGFDPNDSNHKRTMSRLMRSIGSTVSLMKTWRNEKGENMMTVGNIGDSRIYRLRHGALERLTRDDSQVQILLEEGLIANDQDLQQEIDKSKILEIVGREKNPRTELLSLAQKMTQKPGKKITIAGIRHTVLQAAGLKSILKQELGSDFKPFVHTYDMEDGDAFVAVTDGISDNLTDEEIRSIIATHFENPQMIAEELKLAAIKRSLEDEKENARAKPDDMTAVAAVFLGE